MKFQLKSLLSTYHIFSYFDFHSLLPVKKNLTEVFHVKPLRLAFSFLPPVRFEIFTAGFSSRIFIFPLVHWLKKFDYSSLLLVWLIKWSQPRSQDIMFLFQSTKTQIKNRQNNLGTRAKSVFRCFPSNYTFSNNFRKFWSGSLPRKTEILRG